MTRVRTIATPRTAVAVAATACAGLWLLLTVQADRSVTSRAPLLDELYYLDRAGEIRAGDFPGDEPFFMSPLYPLLVAVSGAGRGLAEPGLLPPGDLRGLRLLQGACWLGVVLLLRRSAGRILAEGLSGWRLELAAWLPSLLLVLYRPAAVWGLSVLLEVPLLLLLTVAVDLLLVREWTDRRGLAVGAVLGLAALLRGTALALLPLPLGLAWRRGHGAAARFRGLAAVLLPLLLVMTPAALHNSRLAGRLTGPTLNAGLNLAIGNAPGASGFYRTLWEGDWRTDPIGAEFLADQTGRAEVSIAEADRLWRDRAFAAMRARPGEALRLFAKKVWLYLQGWEIDQLASLDGWTEAVPALRLLVLPWSGLVVLAFAGLGRLFGGDREPGPARYAVRRLAIMAALLLAAQSLFFVVSRYRLALTPELCLLAGAALASALAGRDGANVASQRRRWLPAALAIVAVFLTRPWGMSEVRAQWDGQADANLAQRWALVAAQDGDEDARNRASALYESAVASRTTRPDWWLGLAIVERDAGRVADAEETLAEAIDRFPQERRLQQMMLVILLAQDRTTEALTRADALLARFPEDLETLHNAAVLHARAGDPEGAIELARRLVAAHPDDPRGYVDLGVLLARSGSTAEAAEVFRAGLRVAPDDAALSHNLEWLAR